MKASICIIWIAMSLGNLLAQEKNEVIRQRIEFISEQLESEEIDLTNLTEQLYYYFDHPINLNQASVDQLRSLNLLSDIQINDLILHIQHFGKLISKFELQSLPYWDLSTIHLIEPFIRVDDRFENLNVNFREVFKFGAHEYFLRYQIIPQLRAGYNEVSDSLKEASNSYYHGNPGRYYMRYRFNYGTNVSFGFTAEKDPGETLSFSNEQYGFDFYSAHAFYKGGKYLRSIAIGDYHLQIGQGLNLWTSYAFNKTADATNVKKSAQGLRPYTSADENRFLRGAACEVGYRNFSLTVFGSRKKVDATLIVDSLYEEMELASSINISGFHRTTSEIVRKNAFQEYMAGGNVRFEKGLFQIGASSVFQGFNKSYAQEIEPYNQFNFRGKSFVSSSLDYSFIFKNTLFFGEMAMQQNSKSYANVHGLIISPDSRVDFSLVYRKYDRAYQTLYNNGFSEGSITQNEEGIYTGMNVRFNSKWSVQTYVDYFKFPWLKYLIDGPSEGREFLFQPTFKPNRQFEFYVRYREQIREQNSRDSDGTISVLEPVRQRNYRANISMSVAEGIQLKSRIEWVRINRASNKPENGWLIYQDLILKPKAWPIELSFRYAMFETDSYDSRIYAFESNALYVFSVPGYFYKGTRAYALLRFNVTRRIDIWLRFARTVYSDRSKLGAGPELIDGNVKSDFVIQLRLKF